MVVLNYGAIQLWCYLIVVASFMVVSFVVVFFVVVLNCGRSYFLWWVVLNYGGIVCGGIISGGWY